MPTLPHNITDRVSPNPQTMIHLGNAYENEQGSVFLIDAVIYEGWPKGQYVPPKDVRFCRIRDNKVFVRPGSEVRQQIESEKLKLVATECRIDFRTQTTKLNGLMTVEIIHENPEKLL